MLKWYKLNFIIWIQSKITENKPIYYQKYSYVYSFWVHPEEISTLLSYRNEKRRSILENICHEKVKLDFPTCGATCSGVTKLMLWHFVSFWSLSIRSAISSGFSSQPLFFWLKFQKIIIIPDAKRPLDCYDSKHSQNVWFFYLTLYPNSDKRRTEDCKDQRRWSRTRSSLEVRILLLRNE